MTWYQKKGHWYGHCNNHGEYKKCSGKTCVRQDRLEEQYKDVFDVIAPKSEEVLVEIENILREEHSDRVKERETEASRLNGLLANIRQQKDKYYEAKIDRQVPLDYCERKIAECTKEEEALEATLERLGDENDELLQLGLAVHELAYKSKEIYETADVEDQRLLLSQIFTNLIQNRYEIKPIYSKAAEFLKTWVPKLNYDYELQKTLLEQGQNAPALAKSSNWLPDRDSNPNFLDQNQASYH